MEITINERKTTNEEKSINITRSLMIPAWVTNGHCEKCNRYYNEPSTKDEDPKFIYACETDYHDWPIHFCYGCFQKLKTESDARQKELNSSLKTNNKKYEREEKFEVKKPMSEIAKEIRQKDEKLSKKDYEEAFINEISEKHGGLW